MRTINKTAWYILRQNASVCIPKNAYVSKNENRQGGEEVQDDRVESPNHQLVRQWQRSEKDEEENARRIACVAQFAVLYCPACDASHDSSSG
ncbi:unnamed protein product [Toxocara canis]|uniref:Uncharacterized protein n=1 Tax=Toxocara canis TaxID=6265 RepID=A0A183ULS5_TOXCA|nr:unnamed protein product [Toxocara canis]